MTRNSRVFASLTVVLAAAVAAIVVVVLSGHSTRPVHGVLSTPAAPRVVHAAGAPAGAYLADGAGRGMFLRGVRVTGLVQYAPDYDENPALSAADFQEIAALGFDYVRLPVSWSLL